MARAQDEFSSLRFGRRESERVVVAVFLSVIMHLTFYAGYKVGANRGWWAAFQPPAWLHFLTKKTDLDAHIGHDSPPSIFVDVSHADDDAPAQSKFYSNKNSRAANPETADTHAPKINGRQTEVPRTETVERLVRQANSRPTEGVKDNTPSSGPKELAMDMPKPASASRLAQLQPSMPPPSLEPFKAAPAPDAPQTPGDLDQRPPQKETTPTPTSTAAQPKVVAERPRTLKQALAQRDQLPGPQMQQEGGVTRHAAYASLDVKATAFGDYDRELIAAVQQRWDDLLDNHRYAQDRDGRVILRFKLKPDGTVIEMQTVENSVGEVLGYLCQESIEEAAPFARWPPDMARMIGTNYRDITFTFYYY